MAGNIPRIVIVGGGFGGIKLAKLFAKENVHVTLLDKNNYHLFQPLLYQVSTSMLASDEIAYPIRTFFRDNKNVNFVLSKAEGVDHERKVVLTAHGEIPFDYLVLAAGGTTNYFGNDRVKEHSYAMKTLPQALKIRNHILHMFERADKEIETPEERKRMLTFVMVGGGPTGVEEAGAVAELIEIQKKEYHHLDFSDAKVVLLEAAPCVLPMVPQDLRDRTVDVLRKKGVDVRLNTQVVDYDGETLKLKDGTEIGTRTVVWAAGVKAVKLMGNVGGEVDRAGRVVVNEQLQVGGSECVFAIGDCANFHHGTERPLPTVAPVATQQAEVCVRNIMRLIRGDKNLEAFHYKDLGAMATIGRGEAVVAGSVKMTGFLAWCAWMIVHLMRLEGTHANVTVGLKWTWNLISGVRLGRIITNLNLDDES